MRDIGSAAEAGKWLMETSIAEEDSERGEATLCWERVRVKDETGSPKRGSFGFYF